MNPADDYRRRREAWLARKAILDANFKRIGYARVAVALFTAALAWLAFGMHSLSVWWLLPAIFAFIALAIWHSKVIAQRKRATRAVAYYQQRSDRLEGEWAGTGPTGERFRDSSHVYAEDLDILGAGSLFQLASCARTAAGEETLAHWLLAPATRPVALARQAAVAELRGRIDLREEIALLGEDLAERTNRETLTAWAAGAPVKFRPHARQIALALAMASIATFLAFLGHLMPLWPFLVVLACDLIFRFAERQRVQQALEGVDTPAKDLEILALVLHRLIRESFEDPRLRQLQAALHVDNVSAPARISRLQRWIEMLHSGDHLLVKLIGPALLWQEQVAMGIEAWRRDTGRYASQWLATVGEFEALLSLASLAFERPGWSIPELRETGAVFDSKNLQHPLMSPVACVPNDVTMGEHRLTIVSGSNMSGKSTLLRAVGLNTVLAWSGGPVAATRMSLSPLATGASIRVVDSLLTGKSRFFAEITRIRAIIELTRGPRPVLFLLDELLSGTNSHDRRIGAAAIVRSLVKSGAIGMMTTHDLALTRIEQDLDGLARNVHFDDSFVNGEIEFDYRLKPGIVVRSNAIDLMRSIGLPVDER